MVEPLASGWVAQGPRVLEFERAFAELHGVPHAVACSSGTTALHLILAGLGIGPGDEVLVPSFTWVASANAVRYTGATPVLVDVDTTTYNVDPQRLARHATERTRAVMAVHLFGLCADVAAIRRALPDALVIEDAACAAGGSLAGRMAGSLGVAAAFSFHPRKTITTGEGGMVTTSDAALSERMQSLRNHGAGAVPGTGTAPAPHAMPAFDQVGFNYRMTDLQGAIGTVQLRKLPGFIAQRQRLASRYADGLSDLPWLQLPSAPDAHTYQSYVCLVDEARAGISRNAMMDELAGAGIATRPGTHAVHLLGAYRRDAGPDHLPGASLCDARTMAIPLHNELSDADQDYVIERIRALGS